MVTFSKLLIFNIYFPTVMKIKLVNMKHLEQQVLFKENPLLIVWTEAIIIAVAIVVIS